jgi:fibronectin-binding autotransporter adhesin
LSNLFFEAANGYSGGTTIQSGTTRLGAAGALPATTDLIINGGTLDLSHPTLGSFNQTIASLAGTGGTIANTDSTTTRTLTVNQDVLTTFSGGLTGNMALTKELTGTLILAGTNTYTGLTTINDGTVLVNGSISGGVTVNGGTLGGSGSVGSINVNGSGTLAPGNSPGILNVGSIHLNDQSIFAVELFGTTPGNDFDQLNVTGGIEISGQVTLHVSLGSFDPANLVDIFPIILNDLTDPVQGTFYGLPQGATFTVGSQAFVISYEDDASTPGFELSGGNDIAVMAVPEPGSVTLLLAGVLTFLGSRRRRPL